MPEPAEIASDDPTSETADELRRLAKSDLRDSDAHSKVVALLGRLPHLVELPEAQVEVEAERRLRAIKKSVRDAIDRLTLYPSQPQAELDSRVQGCEALRWLFGLMPDSPNKFGFRRERAATACGFDTADGFRHYREGDLLYLLAHELITSTQTSPTEDPPVAPAGFPPELVSCNGLTVHNSQRELEYSLIEYIRAEKPQTARAILLSSVASLHVLMALRDCSCQIELLLCHRKNPAITEWQRQRIEDCVSDLRDVHFSENDKQSLAISFYNTPPTLRGWQIGQFVGLSWYTYRDDPHGAVRDPRLWGHRNLVVVGDTNCEQGADLASWFDDQFRSLQTHPSTAPDEELYPG